MKSKPVKIDGPVQLSLFTLLPENQKYSISIDLYDAVTNYIIGKDKKGHSLQPIEREFAHKGTKYRAIIRPARVKDGEGAYIDMLPGQREEFVEDALRKLAADGLGRASGEQIGVCVTLYQLKKELDRTGHTYSYRQLREALDILTLCSMELVVGIDGEKTQELFREPLFGRMGARTEDGWDEVS